MPAIRITTILEMAGREAGDVTRRDVARALLSVPAGEAIDGLPELRREMMAAGNPLSAPFWEEAEELLESIVAGEATYGDVRRWLGATGTEPYEMMGWFLWPQEEERGPVAREMHARLVAHLEEALDAGRVDPDLLLAGDEEALAAHRQLQEAWLNQPLADGRVPADEIEEEEAAGWIAEWDRAEAEARQVLEELLADLDERPLPNDELAAVTTGLRRRLPDGGWPYDLAAAAGGVDPRALPADDAEMWLTLASGVVTCRGEPSIDEFNEHEMAEHAAWLSIGLGDWIGAVVSLGRAGPGTYIDPVTLANWAMDFESDGDKSEEGEFDDFVDFDSEWDADTGTLEVGFGVVTTLWEVLGVLDRDGRLTRLGWWGAPEALLEAWAPYQDD